MQKISVLGCGRWGSFIAWYLATKKGKEVYSWGPEEDYSYQVLKNTGKNEYVTLDERITLTCDLAAAVSLMSAVTSYSPASFSASASTFSYVQ